MHQFEAHDPEFASKAQLEELYVLLQRLADAVTEANGADIAESSDIQQALHDAQELGMELDMALARLEQGESYMTPEIAEDWADATETASYVLEQAQRAVKKQRGTRRTDANNRRGENRRGARPQETREDMQRAGNARRRRFNAGGFATLLREPVG